MGGSIRWSVLMTGATSTASRRQSNQSATTAPAAEEEAGQVLLRLLALDHKSGCSMTTECQRPISCHRADAPPTAQSIDDAGIRGRPRRAPFGRLLSHRGLPHSGLSALSSRLWRAVGLLLLHLFVATHAKLSRLSSLAVEAGVLPSRRQLLNRRLSNIRRRAAPSIIVSWPNCGAPPLCC